MEEPGAKGSPPPLPVLEHVYRLAGALGSELQRLSGVFGPGAVAGLVPQVVCLLEVLEALAAGEGGWRRGQEAAQVLGRAVHGKLQPPQQQEEDGGEPLQVLEQMLLESQKREQLLQTRLVQLEEENLHLLAQLAGSQSREDRTMRKEKEVMLGLKKVVDRQRDEIRAQAHKIVCKTRDTEALQEQLNRFMSMNEDLRHKLAVVQRQLQSTLEKKEELESAVTEARQGVDQLSKALAPTELSRTGMEEGAAASGEGLSPSGQGPPPTTTSFSKEELQQILQERNELKTSVFLVQEELAYYQRELLNDERIPGFLLDAMKATIKKQRKKIRAKMLGTVEEPVSSEEEDSGACLTASGSDCVDGPLATSRIKSFFGVWYHHSSRDRSPTDDCLGVWEIVDPQEVGLEEKEEEERKVSPPAPQVESRPFREPDTTG